MALQVGLAPLAPHPVSNFFEKAEGEPKPRKAFFPVFPVSSGRAPDLLHGPFIVPIRGPVPAALDLVSCGLAAQRTEALRNWPSFETS
ncbi:MAG: hypothetical protein KDA56_07045 [Hyphomonas sp.]|nr:hypothetical protein [Hyphomonas sp.]